MAPSTRIRPRWYKLHFSTWAFLLLLGSAIAYLQFVQVYWCFQGMRYHFTRGFPFPYTAEFSSRSQTPFAIHYPLNFIKDLGVWFLLSMPPVIFWERLARARFRFSLKAVFVVLTTAAIVFSRMRWSGFLTGDLEWKFVFLTFWFSVFFSILLLLWLSYDVCLWAHKVLKKKNKKGVGYEGQGGGNF